jgi:class 3 adenylate cyclase
LGAPLTAGIGIDFGKFLLIPGKDAFGDAVNTAHKLGEDVARASEVLVTEEVKRRLAPGTNLRAEPLALSISGLQLEAWRILRQT